MRTHGPHSDARPASFEPRNVVDVCHGNAQVTHCTFPIFFLWPLIWTLSLAAWTPICALFASRFRRFIKTRKLPKSTITHILVKEFCDICLISRNVTQILRSINSNQFFRRRAWNCKAGSNDSSSGDCHEQRLAFTGLRCIVQLYLCPKHSRRVRSFAPRMHDSTRPMSF